MFDLVKFSDRLESLKNKINSIVLNNEYTKKYLDTIDGGFDGDFEDNRLLSFVDNSLFISSISFLNNLDLYNLILGKADIIEILELPDIGDIRNIHLSDLDDCDIEDLRYSRDRLKNLKIRELSSEIKRFAKEAKQYVKKYKIELDQSF